MAMMPLFSHPHPHTQKAQDNPIAVAKVCDSTLEAARWATELRRRQYREVQTFKRSLSFGGHVMAVWVVAAYGAPTR